MKLAVLTSGGDAPGMNAAVRAVTRKGVAGGHAVIGFIDGFEGLVENSAVPLDHSSVSEIIDRGGTILRTARFPAFREAAVQKKGAANLAAAGVDVLLVIGGEGSMTGADRLCGLGARVIGLPASIDNDVFGTDCAVGFDTAVNTVLDVMRKLRDTASAHERTFLIEVMGRRSGAIALAAGVAGGADYLCLPGTPAASPDQADRIAQLIEDRRRRGKTHTLIIVAEGAGSATALAEILARSTNQEIRVSVPGHIQRGGSPSAWDRLLASRLGAYAVELAADGKKGIMVGLVGGRLTHLALADTYTNAKKTDPGLIELAKTIS